MAGIVGRFRSVNPIFYISRGGKAGVARNQLNFSDLPWSYPRRIGFLRSKEYSGRFTSCRFAFMDLWD
jgi:hypothetical protein